MVTLKKPQDREVYSSAAVDMLQIRLQGVLG
jgi:hypothetical protein